MSDNVDNLEQLSENQLAIQRAQAELQLLQEREAANHEEMRIESERAALVNGLPHRVEESDREVQEQLDQLSGSMHADRTPEALQAAGRVSLRAAQVTSDRLAALSFAQDDMGTRIGNRIDLFEENLEGRLTGFALSSAHERQNDRRPRSEQLEQEAEREVAAKLLKNLKVQNPKFSGKVEK
ncbi:hypothetical protein MMC29_005630, partial [Sticta canariensis]|nr:hypothetical protein [Sticta canariensis]